jgi:sporulation protein YlmC with PRC-barrel domain
MLSAKDAHHPRLFAGGLNMSDETKHDHPAAAETGNLILATNLSRLLVSSEAEGAILGHVSHIICDRNAKSVVALGFRENIFKEEYTIPVRSVHRVGRDMLIIESEAAIGTMPKQLPAGQIFFKSLTGTMIVTHAGNMLGRLTDLVIHGDSWAISRLYFDNHHWLDVMPENLTIGPDQILVPAGSTDQIVGVKAEPSWSLARAFDKETYGQLSEKVQKSLRRRKPPEDMPPPPQSSPGLEQHEPDINP